MEILAPVPQLRSPRIWGTFSASGGAGATTLSLHLARVAARSGMNVLLMEFDPRAPLREILRAQPPYWEEYRVSAPKSPQALPQKSKEGFALLTRRSSAPIELALIEEVITTAREHLDLIILDNPEHLIGRINSLLVAESSLPSLIGMNAFTLTHKPRYILINKVKARMKRSPAINGFVTDAGSFTIPKAKDLELALGMGITRTLSRQHEKVIAEILIEMLKQ